MKGSFEDGSWLGEQRKALHASFDNSGLGSEGAQRVWIICDEAQQMDPAAFAISGLFLLVYAVFEVVDNIQRGLEA